MKKILKFISSMRFAVILLVLLSVACVFGSLVTQNQTYDWYALRYGDRTAGLIIALQLDDAFHSVWFIVITAFLCLNLLLCNVIRLPQLLSRTKAFSQPDSLLKSAAGAEDIQDPARIFSRFHMPKPKAGQTADGREYLYSAKNGAGLWGAWICHVGILLLIAGFSLGQMTKKEYTVYGVPGDTKAIGDTGMLLTIDDFQVDLREDDTVSQYTAAITVSDGEETQSAEISVNNPASLHGMKFYQNSTGWAADVSIEKDGKPLQEQILCAGEFVPVQDKPELLIYFNAFYPDYAKGADGMPMTKSGRLDNPAYLYTVYYQGSVLGMNALMEGEDLTIDEYTVHFRNPQNYTLIQIKKDSFAGLALIGGILTMLGLIMAFYLLSLQILAVRSSEEETWKITAVSRKGGAVFRERFEKIMKEEKNEHRPA